MRYGYEIFGYYLSLMAISFAVLRTQKGNRIENTEIRPLEYKKSLLCTKKSFYDKNVLTFRTKYTPLSFLRQHKQDL